MSKYAPLADYLKKQHKEHVPMTFAEIERVTGTKLPASASKHRPWWSNNPDNSVMTRVWLDAGFQSEQVDMSGRKLVFRRVREEPPPQAAESQTQIHAAYGALRGLLRVLDEPSLTRPADPAWAASVDETN